jgi:hypothetical protein
MVKGFEALPWAALAAEAISPSAISHPMIHPTAESQSRRQQGETRVDDSATGRTRRNTSSDDLIGHGYFRLHQYPRTRRQNKAPLCLRLRFTTWCFQCRQVIILLLLPKCGFLLSGAHPTPANSPVPDITLRRRAVTNFTVRRSRRLGSTVQRG